MKTTTIFKIAINDLANLFVSLISIPTGIGCAWLMSRVINMPTEAPVFAFVMMSLIVTSAFTGTVFYCGSKVTTAISVVAFATSMYIFGVSDIRTYVYLGIVCLVTYSLYLIGTTSDLVQVAFSNYVKTGVFTHKDRIYSSIFRAISFEFYALKQCNKILNSKNASENLRKNAKMVRRNLLIREVVFQMKKN